MTFPRTRALLDSAREARVFPAAAIEVGRRAGPLWRDAVGCLTYAPDSPATLPETLFDLASLTKVIVTASIAMKHAAEGAMDLDARVAELLPDWTQGRRADVRIRHLLDHSSGLPAHARLWKIASGRREYERALYTTPLERAPGESAVYSDVGFMLLGFLLEDVGRGSLAEQFRSLWPVDSALAYGTSMLDGHPVAPTEIDPWRGRLLIGEVHDENAAALGGVAGHAGLFGNVEAVGRFAATVLETFSRPTRLGLPDMMKTFAACSRVPGSSRALAWDTMRPTSSCGTRFSPTAIGHTGFTGTSLWIDPADDLYVVFLTNRVHPTREHNTLAPLRPLVHDAVHDDLEG